MTRRARGARAENPEPRGSVPITLSPFSPGSPTLPISPCKTKARGRREGPAAGAWLASPPTACPRPARPAPGLTPTPRAR